MRYGLEYSVNHAAVFRWGEGSPLKRASEVPSFSGNIQSGKIRFFDKTGTPHYVVEPSIEPIHKII